MAEKFWENVLNKKPGTLEEATKPLLADVQQAPVTPAPQVQNANITEQDFLVQNAQTEPVTAPEMSKIEQALTKSQDLYEQAQLTGMNAIQQGARLEQAHYEKLAKEREKQAAELERQTLADEQLKNEERKKVESVYNEFKQAKVDPNNWYNSKSTAGKVTAGIGLILGGMGAGLAGGPNQALQTMYKAIDDDISSQEKAIEVKRDGYTMAEKSYQNLVASLGDKQKARLVAQANALENMENQFKARMAGVKGQQAQAQGMQALAQIQEKRAETIAKIDTLNAKTGPDAERFVPGYGVALTKDDAKLAKDASMAHIQGTRSIDELIRMRKELGAELFTGANAAKAKALARSAQLALKKSAQLGVLSAADMPFLEEQIPSDPTELGQVLAKLEQTRKGMDTHMNAFAEAYGLRPMANGRFGVPDTKETRAMNVSTGK